MASDFSVFHRLDDPESLPPQRYIDLAVRLVHYAGACRAALQVEAAKEEAPLEWNDDLRSDRVVDSSAASLAIDPILAGVIEIA